MEADGADSVEAVCEWLASEAGLCVEEVHEARPLLLLERVYTVHRLELLRQEGCLREVFGARITSRLVSDALGRREAAALPPAAPALPTTPELHNVPAAEASQALLAALDTRDVPTIRTLLAAYADSVQGVQLQSSAFELLTRVGAAKEAELDTLISRMRALAAVRRPAAPAGLARGAAPSVAGLPLPSTPEGLFSTPEGEGRAWAGAGDGVAYSGEEGVEEGVAEGVEEGVEGGVGTGVEAGAGAAYRRRSAGSDGEGDGDSDGSGSMADMGQGPGG